MNPLVSILIPCFNAGRWIGQAIDSVLAQTWPEKEVVVVDDGSTDGSLKIIKSYGERVRWETGPNRGGNAARNRLLALSRGEWLQYLDADDYLRPDKLATEIRFIKTQPGLDILFRPFIHEHWSERETRIENTVIPEPHDPWILLARWYLPGTGSGLWRKAAIIEAGGWNERQPCCQEHELYLRLLMAGRNFKYLAGGGYVYRQWSQQTVCKRNVPEAHRQRLGIMQRAEDFMRKAGQLTPERLQALNQGRFDTARMVWRYNPPIATEIMRGVGRSQPDFMPAGVAAPGGYRFVYRFAGFRCSELIAGLRRRLLNVP